MVKMPLGKVKLSNGNFTMQFCSLSGKITFLIWIRLNWCKKVIQFNIIVVEEIYKLRLNFGHKHSFNYLLTYQSDQF